MLYKNLPPQELNKVMRVRAFLDYVAALQYLLKGQLDNVKAVFHARSEYKRLRSYFLKAREENLRKTYVDSIPERIKSSISVSYTHLDFYTGQRYWYKERKP